MIISFISFPIIYLDLVILAREQVWILPGFQVSTIDSIVLPAFINGLLQEQLVLFELCRYAPHENEGIYRKWRQKIASHV